MGDGDGVNVKFLSNIAAFEVGGVPREDDLVMPCWLWSESELIEPLLCM
jgi:hypothetical protein